MFCIWCGAQVADDCQFCPECGGNLHPGGISEPPSVQQPISTPPPMRPAPPVQPQVWNPPPQPPPMAPPPRPNASHGALIGVLIAVICVLAAAAVILTLKLFVWKDDDSSASVSEQPTTASAYVPSTGQSGGSAAPSEPSATPTPTLEPTPSPTPDPNSYYIIPDSNSRYLTRADLIGLTDSELRLARNEIYARRGRLFDDEALQAYFNQQPWYQGTIAPGDFTQSMLNDYEIKNANLILEYENER